MVDIMNVIMNDTTSALQHHYSSTAGSTVQLILEQFQSSATGSGAGSGGTFFDRNATTTTTGGSAATQLPYGYNTAFYDVMLSDAAAADRPDYTTGPPPSHGSVPPISDFEASIWEHLLNFFMLILAPVAIILCTLIGNILVIISIFTYRPLRSTPNFFIISLAVADITVAVFVMPFHVLYALTETWHYGLFMCKMWVTCDVLCCTASILNLCAIALDRYWAIHDPINYASKRTPKRVLSIIALVWLISAVISIPPLIGWNDWPEASAWNIPGKPPPECRLTEEKGYLIYSSMGSFYIPLVIMSLVYAKIYLATKRRLRERAQASALAQKRRSQRQQASNLVQTTHFSNSPAISKYCASEKPSSEHGGQDGLSATVATTLPTGGGSNSGQVSGGPLMGTSSTFKSSPTPVSPSAPPQPGSLLIPPAGGTVPMIAPKVCFEPPSDTGPGQVQQSSSGTDAEVSCYVSGDSADLPLQPPTTHSNITTHNSNTATHKSSIKSSSTTPAPQLICTCAPQQGGYDIEEEDDDDENTQPDSSDETSSPIMLAQHQQRGDSHSAKAVDMSGGGGSRLCQSPTHSLPANIKHNCQQPAKVNFIIAPAPHCPIHGKKVQIVQTKTIHQDQKGAHECIVRVDTVGSGGQVITTQVTRASTIEVEDTVSSKDGAEGMVNINLDTISQVGVTKGEPGDDVSLLLLTPQPGQMSTSTLMPPVSTSSGGHKSASSGVGASLGAGDHLIRDQWEQKQRISLTRERRAARVLGIVMGMFVACWLPFFVIYLIPFCDCWEVGKTTMYLITWLGYVNSAANPLIYTIFNMDFRRAFKKLLCDREICCGMCGTKRNRAAQNSRRASKSRDAISRAEAGQQSTTRCCGCLNVGGTAEEELSVGPVHSGRRSASVAAGSMMLPFGFMSRLSSRRSKRRKQKKNKKKSKNKTGASEQYDNNAHEIEEIGIVDIGHLTATPAIKQQQQQQKIKIMPMVHSTYEPEEGSDPMGMANSDSGGDQQNQAAADPEVVVVPADSPGVKA